MHVDLDAVGMPGADADEQVFHQPAIFFSAGFEFRHRAEIDQSGMDGLAFGNPVKQFLWPEPNPDILDVDNGAVVHLKGVFRRQFREAIGANDLEVRTNRKDRAVDAFPENLAAKDRNDSPDPVPEIAADHRGTDVARY